MPGQRAKKNKRDMSRNKSVIETRINSLIDARKTI